MPVVKRSKTGEDVMRDARRTLRLVNEAGARRAAVAARALCPVSDNNEPGHVHLRDTIRYEVDEKTGAATVTAGDPERGVDYVVWIELGTHLRPAHPFLLPAMKLGSATAKETAESSVRKR